MAPFRGAERVAVVPPSVDETGEIEEEATRRIRSLIEREHFEKEDELRDPVLVANERTQLLPALLIGPRAANPSITELELPEHRVPTVTFLADDQLLIADGHHRYETALRYSQEATNAGAPRPEHAFFMVFFANGDE
jgi:hypothetical protein